MRNFLTLSALLTATFQIYLVVAFQQLLPGALPSPTPLQPITSLPGEPVPTAAPLSIAWDPSPGAVAYQVFEAHDFYYGFFQKVMVRTWTLLDVTESPSFALRGTGWHTYSVVAIYPDASRSDKSAPLDVLLP